MLGRYVPQVSVYFMTFVLARIGITLPMMPLQIYTVLPAMAGLIKIDDPQYIWYAYEGTNVTIVLVIVNMYCVVSPLIAPVAAFYFFMAKCVYRWMFKNVYVEEADATGSLFPVFIGGSMIGLLFGKLTLLGVSGLRVDPQATECVIISLLPPAILFFMWQLHGMYEPFAHYLPYEDAVTLDRTTSDEVAEDFDENFFLDPLLKENFTGIDDDDDLSSDGDDSDSDEDGNHSSTQETTGSDSDYADGPSARELLRTLTPRANSRARAIEHLACVEQLP
eukprot:TRINITY_DN10006_c0_g1_i3.p1 TRINITY_DN10006_c0_g1~~TRINITY_DN10006_c0_g1_i3.p1  ORF type:complete len:278 (-),score=71.48 TRINITY_DN10006_c0_g1_i3:267-1100(-)